MMLRIWFREIHAALEERRGFLFTLVATGLYLLLVAALPATLVKLEDNIDGLNGYASFVVGFILAWGLLYALAAALIYRFTPPRARTLWVYLGLVLTFTTLVFGFVLQLDAGVLDLFKFSQPDVLTPTGGMVVTDLALLAVCFVAAGWLLARHTAAVVNGLGVLLLACPVLTAVGLYSVHDRINRKSEEEFGQGKGALFSFSQTGKNMLLIFVDGAMTGYLPDILREDPTLEERFRGFTWYSNVVSTGNRTLNGLPAVFGGFDYTVSAINARPGGTLKEKLSAAYRPYVENFHERGYQVLYSDPFWFGLERKGDCEYFNQQYEPTGQGRCIHTIGKQVADKKAAVREGRSGELFMGLAKQYVAISLFKAAPRFLKRAVYGEGQWLGLSYAWKQREDKYLNNFFSLVSIGEFANTAAPRDTFTFITTELTRAPLFVNEETCIPNRALSTADPRIAELLGRYHDPDTVAIYQTTKCAVQGLAKLMDWLRAQGIYDNTMVVLASDHGWLSHNPLLAGFKDRTAQQRFSMFQAFLMTKPYGSAIDLTESKEFISNANVPGLICETIGGCFDRATGKTIRFQPLTEPVLLHETPWQGKSQKSDAFIVEAMYRVQGDVRARASWEDVLPPARSTP